MKKSDEGTENTIASSIHTPTKAHQPTEGTWAWHGSNGCSTGVWAANHFSNFQCRLNEYKTGPGLWFWLLQVHYGGKAQSHHMLLKKLRCIRVWWWWSAEWDWKVFSSLWLCLHGIMETLRSLHSIRSHSSAAPGLRLICARPKKWKRTIALAGC